MFILMTNVIHQALVTFPMWGAAGRVIVFFHIFFTKESFPDLKKSIFWNFWAGAPGTRCSPVTRGSPGVGRGVGGVAVAI